MIVWSTQPQMNVCTVAGSIGCPKMHCAFVLPSRFICNRVTFRTDSLILLLSYRRITSIREKSIRVYSLCRFHSREVQDLFLDAFNAREPFSLPHTSQALEAVLCGKQRQYSHGSSHSHTTTENAHAKKNGSKSLTEMMKWCIY